MNVKGWILETYQDIPRNKLVIYVLDENGELSTKGFIYYPKLYISGDEQLIKRIIYSNIDAIKEFYNEKWYSPPWYRKLKKVWVLKFYSLEDYYMAIKLLRAFHEVKFWNLYPSLSTMFFINLGISPMLLIDLDRMKPLEDIYDIEYALPTIRRVYIRLLDWYGDVYNPFKHKPSIYHIEFYEDSKQYVEDFSDIDGLVEFIKLFKPHVLEADYSGVFKFLSKFIDMNKYIKIEYSRSVFNHRDFHGLIELSRLARIGLERLSRYSIGYILTTMEASNALRMKRLIPDKRVDIEGFKRIRFLTAVDRGGIIHTPSPGIYWNVAQCDFMSLYPTIIVKYNIGVETVNYRRCKSFIKVPESNHRICMDIPSIAAETLKYLVRRRIVYKRLARSHNDPISEARQRVLKWILVASFGYLGYRNAKFGKIEAYESVTSYARDIIKKAVKVIESEGYKVIHILIDGLFIYREDASVEDYLSICNKVSKTVGLKMELDFHYKWLYIPPNRRLTGAGCINRYVGVDYKGDVKAKGIELVRRDYPQYIKELQTKILNILSKASDPQSLDKAALQSLKIVDEYVNAIKKRKVPLDKLIITKYISKISNDLKYRSKRMPYRYIVSIDGPIPVERWRMNYLYDITYYLNLLYSSLYSLPIPL